MSFGVAAWRVLLAAWKHPVVGSTQAAERAMHGPIHGFSYSSDLERLRAMLEPDERISFPLHPRQADGRILIIEVLEDDLPEVATLLSDASDECSVVLYDLTHSMLVCPGRSRRTWLPSAEDPVHVMRHALANVPASADAARTAAAMDEAVREALGAEPPTLVPVNEVSVPLTVPRELKFAVPIAIPAKRQTARALQTLLRKATAAQAQTRRGAVVQLAGWAQSEVVVQVMRELASSDPDQYVRALACIALALHRSEPADVLLGLASDVVATEARGTQSSSEPSSLAVFATIIALAHRWDGATCAKLSSLLDALEQWPEERPNAGCLRSLAAEACS